MINDSDFIEFVDKSPNKVENSLWCEKYRPKKLSEFIGSSEIKQFIQNCIDKKDIPHLLFYGKNPGSGKTSLSKLLVNHIKCDYLYINASDEMSIDFIRTKVKDFACSVGFNPLKVIILDEFDRNNVASAQSALRNVLETYSLTTRFIFTCNYVQNIIEPIQSRCQCFEVKPLSKKEIAIHLTKILDNEKVKYSPEDIAFVVNSYYPDIRKCINFCQQSNVNGTIKIIKENAIETDFKNKLVEMIKDKVSFNEIRKFVADTDISSFDELYSYLYEKVDYYAKGKEALVILEIAEGIYKSSLIFEKEIPFMACVIGILRILNK